MRKWGWNYAVLIARIKAFTPEICVIRFRLWAITSELISLLTRGNVPVRKCIAPIDALSVPNVKLNGRAAKL